MQATEMEPIRFGGWTPTSQHDHCAGGHPGGHYLDEHGLPTCRRCGRNLDLSPCGCELSGHEGVARSYCPMRVRDDRDAVARTPEIAERDRVIVARLTDLLVGSNHDAQWLADYIGMSTVRVQAVLDGERCLRAGEVRHFADCLDVSVNWLVYGTETRTPQTPVGTSSLVPRRTSEQRESE